MKNTVTIASNKGSMYRRNGKRWAVHWDDPVRWFSLAWFRRRCDAELFARSLADRLGCRVAYE